MFVGGLVASEEKERKPLCSSTSLKSEMQDYYPFSKGPCYFLNDCCLFSVAEEWGAGKILQKA